jgi:hypothetical protein
VSKEVYEVKAKDLLDLIDAARAAEHSGTLTRCPGGRVILSGYMCIICGNDPSIRFNMEGEEVYQRTPGQITYGRCKEPSQRTIDNEDLAQMSPLYRE